MESYSMFMDKKTQYCQNVSDVSSSQLATPICLHVIHGCFSYKGRIE